VKRLGVSLVAVAALVSATTALAADPRDEKERLNAADNALAKRAVVVRGWLPAGWSRSAPSPDSGSDNFRCPGFNPDFSRFTITGEAGSAFKHPSGAAIASDVAVFQTRAQAVADFRLSLAPGLARCMRTTLLNEFRKEDYAKGLDVSVSVRMTSPPRIGERSEGMRVAVRMSPKKGVAGRTVTLIMDALAFQKGRSFAFLTYMSASGPVTAQVPVARAMAARMA
jgi:hypothetical protein